MGWGVGLRPAPARPVVVAPPPPPPPPTPAQKRARLLEIIQGERGVVEATGHNDGVRVQQYLAAIHLSGDFAYCSGFCVWCFWEADYRVPAYGRASSWFTPARTIYRRDAPRPLPATLGSGQLRAARQQLAVTPRPTDLVGYWWAGATRIGHVGFLVTEWGQGATVHTTEGNTFRAGFTREGNGVWENVRPKRMIYAVARAIE